VEAERAFSDDPRREGHQAAAVLAVIGERNERLVAAAVVRRQIHGRQVRAQALFQGAFQVPVDIVVLQPIAAESTESNLRSFSSSAARWRRRRRSAAKCWSTFSSCDFVVLRLQTTCLLNFFECVGGAVSTRSNRTAPTLARCLPIATAHVAGGEQLETMRRQIGRFAKRCTAQSERCATSSEPVFKRWCRGKTGGEDGSRTRLDGFAGRSHLLEINELGENRSFAPHGLACIHCRIQQFNPVGRFWPIRHKEGSTEREHSHSATLYQVLHLAPSLLHTLEGPAA
jgi:hypothetical protein